MNPDDALDNRNEVSSSSKEDGCVMGIVGIAVAIVLELLTFSTLLDNNSILQVIFYGPLLLLHAILDFGCTHFNWPVPTTMFGGYPDWINLLLLFINWLIYVLLGFFIGKRIGTRKE